MDSAIKRLDTVAKRFGNPDLDDAVAAVKRAWEQAKRRAATPAVAQRPPEDDPWRPSGA
jgi:hypothetical protein